MSTPAGGWARHRHPDGGTILLPPGVPPPWEHEHEPDTLVFPGPRGADGAAGAAGVAGVTGPWIEYPHEHEPDTLVFPGPRGADGAAGAAGAAGIAGATGPWIEYPHEHEPDTLVFPGPRGADGAQGASGSVGAAGPALYTEFPHEHDEPITKAPGPQSYDGSYDRWMRVKYIPTDTGEANQNPPPNETIHTKSVDNIFQALTVLMTTSSLKIGLYLAEYFVLWQSSAVGNGISFSLNFTGTAAPIVSNRHYGSTGAAAATGVADGVAAVLTGSLVEHDASRVNAGALGPNTGVDTINADILDYVRALFEVTVVGNLQFRGTSEAAVDVRVQNHTMLRLTRYA